MTKLHLNMIVRNEAGRIIRALDSVKNYVSSVIILDTGSTDNTVDLIKDWGERNKIGTIIGLGHFVNFEQARNQALDMAQSATAGDYLLLMDADMELVVEDQRAFDGLIHEAYEMVQAAGGVSYNNLRLLKVGSPARYRGVTHEYLDVAAAAIVHGAFFIDHADGSNRLDKFERDIKLLKAGLEDEPDNARYWFYLANSYRDAGLHEEAIRAFRRRVQLGGWDEEVWNAQVHLAGCKRAQGRNDEFVVEALKAYQMRPQRAEPLHDLAKHFREKGDNAIAMIFAEKGIHMQRPDDRLFVADWVYAWGFREEISIAAFYQDDMRERGYKITDGLALDPLVPDHVRNRARRDMVFYLPRLQEMCPSTRFNEITYHPRKGFVAMNPCVCEKPNGDLEVLLRTVNYKIDAEGRYMIGPQQCGDAPIETENYLLRLGRNYEVVDAAPVVWDRPAARFPLVIGLEDMRIFWHRGERKFYANVREQREDGMPTQYHGYLRWRATQPEQVVVEGALPISDGSTCEKNWTPFCYGGANEELVYRLDTLGVIEHHLPTFEKCKRKQAVDNISGSSQWVQFGSGMLAVVHEAVVHPSTGKRVYQHRFAYTNRAFDALRLSRPFVFQDVQIEFCAGLATRGSDMVLSFGVRDEQAMLATVSRKDIECALGL